MYNVAAVYGAGFIGVKGVFFFGCAFLQPMLCPLPQTALTSTSVSPSSALPGDALNSVVDPRFNRDPPVLATKEPSSVGLVDSFPSLGLPGFLF